MEGDDELSDGISQINSSSECLSFLSPGSLGETQMSERSGIVVAVE